MQPADRIEFVKVLNGLAALKPGGKLTPESIDLYWRAMQDWSIDEFATAAVHLLKHHPYPTVPLPADFERLRNAGEPTAAEAWTIVLSGTPLPPGGRMWRAAESVGGQYAIRHADFEYSLPHMQRRFLEAYADMTKVDPVREALPQVAAHGTRRALSAATNIGAFIPQILQRVPSPTSVVLSLPAPVAPAPKLDPVPTKTARDKIVALLPLQMDDDAIAKISGQSVDLVRQVRAEQECAA
jgi:hypothetical protein